MRTEKQLKNLEKNKFKTSEAGKEAGRKGGIASGKKRRELKEIRKWLEEDLFSKLKNSKGEKLETFKVIFSKMKQMAVGGNLKAQEMYLNYAGLKPIDKIENMGQIQVQKIFITEKDIEEVNDIINKTIK